MATQTPQAPQAPQAPTQTRPDEHERVVYTTPPKRLPVSQEPTPQPAAPPIAQPDKLANILRWGARMLALLTTLALAVAVVRDALGASGPSGGTLMLTLWLVLLVGVLFSFIADVPAGIVLVVGAVAAAANILANNFTTLTDLLPLVALLGVLGIVLVYCGWRDVTRQPEA